MAGDWIVWTKGLARKREVLQIARATGRSRFEVAGMLMEFWEWIDQETADGMLCGLTVEELSALHADKCGTLIGALVAVGWLTVSPDGLRVPNFGRWMGRSAKRRLQDSQRKQALRAGANGKSVRKRSGHSADKRGTREEKSIDKTDASHLAGTADATLFPESEKAHKKPRTKAAWPEIPPALDTAEFRAAWDRWLAYLAERRKRYPSIASEHLKILVAMGPAGAVAAIQYSITRGYNEPFAPDDNFRNGTAPGESYEEQLRRRIGSVPADAAQTNGVNR